MFCPEGSGIRPSHHISLVELADAQAEIRTEAATAPHSTIPLPVLTSQDETVRLVVLSLLNVIYAWAILPHAFALIPMITQLKQGKPEGQVENYRQVSLLSDVFKLYDKILHGRIQPRVLPHLMPWQTGGIQGSDEAGWLLNELLCVRAQQMRRPKTWLGFLDGEAAYCRPGPALVFVGLKSYDVDAGDWLAVDSILGKTFGTVKLGSSLYGRWPNVLGVPQGGSQVLFEVTGITLHNELLKAGCGVVVALPNGVPCRVVCFMIVDDIVLSCATADELRRALLIVDRWASVLRLRWNIGAGKSAYMLWGSGPPGKRDSKIRLTLRSEKMPRIKVYKYGGVMFSSGGWGHQLEYVRKRTLQKTRGLVGWGRRLQVTVDIRDRIWRIYVERSVLFGIGFVLPSDTGIMTLYRIQWVAGRMLLGYASRCPSPVVGRAGLN